MFASAPPSKTRRRPWEADMTHHDMQLSRRATLAGMAGFRIGGCPPRAGLLPSGAAPRVFGKNPSAPPFPPHAFVCVGRAATGTGLFKHIQIGPARVTG